MKRKCVEGTGSREVRWNHWGTCFLILFIVLMQPALGENQWSKMKLGEVDNLEVVLEYRSSASVADDEWIRFVFINKGDAPIEIKDIYYDINRETYSRDGKSLLRSGGLASGNEYDMFPPMHFRGSRSSVVVNSNSSISAARFPSWYSSALLGLPPREGVLVKARLRALRIEMGNGDHFEIPPEGVGFELMWNHPTEEGMAQLVKRLDSLLQMPAEKMRSIDAYMMGMLLKIEDASAHLTATDVLNAIDMRNGGFDGRRKLVRFLKKRPSDLDEIINFYRERIQQQDSRVCDDLRIEPSFWRNEFIEPLVVMHEHEENSPPYRSLQLLAEHDTEWKEDAEITQRLSAVIKKQYGWVLDKSLPEIIDDKMLESWTIAVRELAKTRDAALVSYLTPFLDCKEQVGNPEMYIDSRNGRSLPYRCCDFALEAILTVLDGNVRDAYKRNGLPLQLTVKIAENDQLRLGDTTLKVVCALACPSWEQETIFRDVLILKTKERLGVGDKNANIDLRKRFGIPIIKKIAAYRSVHGEYPRQLSEIGFKVDGVKGLIMYHREADGSYFFGYSLDSGESTLYISSTDEWL